MITKVIPPPGVFGFGRSRTVQVAGAPLGGLTGFLLVMALADRGIRLQLVGDGKVLHLHALAPMSTADEVTALRAFARVTDTRIAWHPAAAHQGGPA